jgi:hypothetical protein
LLVARKKNIWEAILVDIAYGHPRAVVKITKRIGVYFFGIHQVITEGYAGLTF